MNLKDLVQPGQMVRFSFYRDQTLFYIHDNGLEFPVPLDDVGNATFKAEDKAIFFMRYLRKHLNTLKKAKEAREVSNA